MGCRPAGDDPSRTTGGRNLHFDGTDGLLFAGNRRAPYRRIAELAAKVMPERASLVGFRDAAGIRAEIAAAAPNYAGIEQLRNKGEVFQWGGAWLREAGVCPTADGRGSLIAIGLPENRKPDGYFNVTTRRGKQFNSMVYGEKDPFNAADRYDVLMNEKDAEMLGIRSGDAVTVYNRYGTFHGRAKFDMVREGNIEVYWPEGNMLVPKSVYEPYVGIPEYNTAVIVEKAETFHAHKDTMYLEKRIDDMETEAG